PAAGKVGLEAARAQRTRRAASDRSRGVDLVVPVRLGEQKRPALALEVAATLRDSMEYDTQVAVHYYGAGPYQPERAEAAVQPGVHAVFDGWVEGWFEDTPGAAVMLLTSHSEGFANVLVESAAYGIPVVAASRALGVADAIVPGITG